MRATAAGGPVRADTLALLGVGYMGGSLALAARRAGLVGEVVGYDVSADALAVAQQRGIVDRSAPSAVDAVRGAELIVLAGPVGSLVPLARLIEDVVSPDALVIDIGSVKAPVVEGIEATSLAGRYVGCHPLAGTEATGPGAADEALYAGKPCFVSPGPKARADAIAAAVAFWEGLGATVLRLAPEPHDDFMAAASHLPHVGAFALAASLEPAADMLVERIPPSFPPTSLRDSTRVAASNPAVWRDIMLANRQHLLPLVRGLEAEVATLRAALEAGDGAALEAALARGRATRRRLVRPG
jgi:prephenate dehydrogenase